MEVLIVRYHPIQEDLILDAIVNSGHQVTLAHSSQDALKQLRQKTFDLAILDTSSNDISSFKIIEQIKNTGIEPLFIVMTDSHSLEMEHKARQAGIACYMIKPTDIDNLTSIINHISNK